MIDELCENIRRNTKKALALVNLPEQEALHDFIVHIDTIAQEIQSEMQRLSALHRVAVEDHRHATEALVAWVGSNWRQICPRR